jgi:uncharacterized protein (TIGR03435 family)
MWLLLFLASAAFAQSPRFEVATIKPSDPARADGTSGIHTGRGRLTATNVTLKRCILGAFRVRPSQIVGGPDWMDSDAFDIVGKAEEPVGDQMLAAMFQTLLAERFKLVLHRETRTMQAYVLDVASRGPKLEKADGGEGKTITGRGTFEARNTTMATFAEVLSRQMDLPVVNQTGLDGVFHLKLVWSPDDTAEGVSIFTAIQEQLGLLLRSLRVPLEVLVIDSAQKPSAN